MHQHTTTASSGQGSLLSAGVSDLGKPYYQAGSTRAASRKANDAMIEGRAVQASLFYLRARGDLFFFFFFNLMIYLQFVACCGCSQYCQGDELSCVAPVATEPRGRTNPWPFFCRRIAVVIAGLDSAAETCSGRSGQHVCGEELRAAVLWEILQNQHQATVFLL
jgi:hypothetical protein